MRRQALVSLLCLVFLMSSSLFLAGSTGGQTIPTLSPEDAVQLYLDSVLGPALGRTPLPGDKLRSFYSTGLAEPTREQIGEDQFMDFWKHVSSLVTGTTASFSLRYSISATLENDAHDQALVLVTGSVDSRPSYEFSALFGKLPPVALVGCVSDFDLHRSSSDCTRGSLADTGGEFDALYWVVREDNVWKLVLSDSVVKEMQKINSHVTVRRFRPNIATTQSGLTIRVREVDLRTESTTLRLFIENGADVEAGLRNALYLASLTDDRGMIHETRILRSTIPEIVAAHSSVNADLTFEALPVDSKTLFLSLPSVRVRDSELTMTLDFALLPFPPEAVIRTPIPGEPVLLYLLTVFRPTFTTEETIKTVYRTLLSSVTRGQVTEREFVDYHWSAAFDAWLCRLGLPDDFTIGAPTSPAPRETSIPVMAVRRGHSVPRAGTTTANALTFRVVEEAETWKLALPEDVVKEMNVHPPLPKRYRLQADGGGEGLSVTVTEVDLDADKTIVRLSIQNTSDREIQYYGGATSLTVDRRQYSLRSSTLPDVVRRRSTFLWVFSLDTDADLEFPPLHLGARELALHVGNFDIEGYTVGVDIKLDPALACR